MQSIHAIIKALWRWFWGGYIYIHTHIFIYLFINYLSVETAEHHFVQKLFYLVILSVYRYDWHNKLVVNLYTELSSRFKFISTNLFLIFSLYNANHIHRVALQIAHCNHYYGHWKEQIYVIYYIRILVA